MATEKQRIEEERKEAPTVVESEVPEEIRIHIKEKLHRNLPVKLTEQETLEHARSLSKQYQDLAEVESDKAEAAKAFARQIKEISGVIAKISKAISTGEEERPVECEVRLDYVRAKAFTVRLDTGETISTRDLFDNEKQENLF